MADHAYTVTTSKHATTDAAGVDTVTFSGVKAGFRIQNRSTTAGLFYSWAAASPVVPNTAGTVDGSYWLPAGASDAKSGLNSTVVVKVTSTAAVAYSAESWPVS